MSLWVFKDKFWFQIKVDIFHCTELGRIFQRLNFNFTFHPAQAERYDIYTRVAVFMEWIEGVILKNGGMNACGYVLENSFSADNEAGFQKGEETLSTKIQKSASALLQTPHWTWFCSLDLILWVRLNFSTWMAQLRSAARQVFRSLVKTTSPLSQGMTHQYWPHAEAHQAGQVVNQRPEGLERLTYFLVFHSFLPSSLRYGLRGIQDM